MVDGEIRIGGLSSRSKIVEAIVWPMKEAERFKKIIPVTTLSVLLLQLTYSQVL